MQQGKQDVGQLIRALMGTHQPSTIPNVISPALEQGVKPGLYQGPHSYGLLANMAASPYRVQG